MSDPLRDWEERTRAVEALQHVTTCAYCDSDLEKFEVDHVVPVSRGGRDHISNMVKTCQRCNRQKNVNLWCPVPHAVFGDGTQEFYNWDEPYHYCYNCEARDEALHKRNLGVWSNLNWARRD